MASGLKHLLDSLKGSRGAVLPGTQAFPPPDCEQIARDLDLSGRALRRASNDAAGIADLAELDARKEFEGRASNARDEYRHRLDLYESRIREASLAGDLRIEIDAAGEAALSDYKMLSINDRNHLHVLRGQVMGREAEYHEFRRAHHLSRLPRVVSGRQKTAMYLVMALLFCMESILNGLFFAKGSEGGLIGGVSQAMALSLINMVPAFLYASYGVPLLLHRKPSPKIIGIAFTLIYLALLFGVNFTIAHFREVFVTSEGEVAMAILLDQVRTQPFGLQDAQSWVLGLMGIGISIFTLISAMRLDDPYPGYGELGRNRDEAIANYAHQKEACLMNLAARRSDAVQDMTDIIRELNSYGYDKELARTGRVRLNEEFSNFLNLLAECHRRIVLEYREQLSLNGARPSEHSAIQRPGFLDRPLLAPLPELDDQGRAIALQRLEHYIKAINDEYARVASGYDTASDLATMSTSNA